MLDDSSGADVCRASDLELLQSGNFADVKIVCGDRSWDCHIAILTSRSTWFRKALAGPFEEASTRKVELNEENPTCIDLALKYIYGGELDVESSVSDEHFVEHCVLLWHTADFLLLHPLKPSVQQAVRNYCDKRMKHLCTREIGNPSKWRDPQDKSKLLPWAADFLSGIRSAYEWKAEDLKSVLMEFIWVGRRRLLGRKLPAHNSIIPSFVDHLNNTSTFMADLLSDFASGPWINTAVWAPKHKWNGGTARECGLCAKEISWQKFEESVGQVYDPFTVDHTTFEIGRGWCRDCMKGDIIPWRA